VFSFAARFRAVPSAADHVGGSSSLFAGGVVACLRSQLGALPLVVAGCALGEGGHIRHSVPVGSGSPSGGPFGSPSAGFFGDFGGRADVEVTITPRVYLSVGGELVGIDAQRSLYSGIVPGGSGSAGLGGTF
jgi:hypothetical protein